MDGVALVAAARSAGLRVSVVAGRLEVRGPRAAAAAGAAEALLAAKDRVVLALDAEDPEVAWRAAAMSSGVTASGPLPLLIARPLGSSSGACPSCGDRITDQ